MAKMSRALVQLKQLAKLVLVRRCDPKPGRDNKQA